MVESWNQSLKVGGLIHSPATVVLDVSLRHRYWVLKVIECGVLPMGLCT